MTDSSVGSLWRVCTPKLRGGEQKSKQINAGRAPERRSLHHRQLLQYRNKHSGSELKEKAKSAAVAGKAVVLLHVCEAEGGEEGGLDPLTQAGLLGLAEQAGHSVIYRGGMQHAAAGANYRVFIFLSPSLSLSDCEPADQNQPTPTLLRCQLQPSDKMQKCTHTHTHTHEDRCLDNIYDSGDYARCKNPQKL